MPIRLRAPSCSISSQPCDGQRQFVHGNLIALGQIGIEIIFAREAGNLLHAQISASEARSASSTRAAVEHRQRARQAQATGQVLLVWRIAKARGAARRKFSWRSSAARGLRARSQAHRPPSFPARCASRLRFLWPWRSGIIASPCRRGLGLGGGKRAGAAQKGRPRTRTRALVQEFDWPNAQAEMKPDAGHEIQAGRPESRALLRIFDSASCSAARTPRRRETSDAKAGVDQDVAVIGKQARIPERATECRRLGRRRESLPARVAVGVQAQSSLPPCDVVASGIARPADQRLAHLKGRSAPACCRRAPESAYSSRV